MDFTTLAQFGVPGVVVGVAWLLANKFLDQDYTLKIELAPRKKDSR